jgi:hypothetical protein
MHFLTFAFFLRALVAARAACEQRTLSYAPHFTARVSCTGFRGPCAEIGDDADAFVAAAVPYDLWDASVSDFEPEGCRVDRHEHDLFGRARGPGPRQLAGVRLSAPCAAAALETVAFTLNGTALVEPVRFPLFMGLGFANHTETLWSNAAWFHAGPTMFEFLTSCRVVGFFSVALVLALLICLCVLCSWRCRGRAAFVVRVDDADDSGGEFSSDDEEAPNRQLVQKKTREKKKKKKKTEGGSNNETTTKKKDTNKKMMKRRTYRDMRRYRDGGGGDGDTDGSEFTIGSADGEGDDV